MTASLTNVNNFLAKTTANSVTTVDIESDRKLDLVADNYQDLHSQPANQLVFIDSQLEDYQNLVAGVLPNMTVVVLDPDGDGIEQISQVLALHRQVNSLHIVSHGAPGRLYLGNSQLSHETLDRYTSQLIGWANALTANAQLLIYGCEVAQTPQGMAFVRRLSELTGAVVAASDRLIGSRTLGGNWELNISTGAIASGLAFQEQAMTAYSSVLGKVVLDTTFNTTGKVTTNFNASNDGSYSVAVQDDGKILVAGYSNNGTDDDFAIARYNSDGTLDTTFNTTGKVTTDFNADKDGSYSIAVQDDGKILVAGYSNNGTDDDFAIARYNSDGSLDTTFNTTGKVTTDFNASKEGGNSIAIQDDGKILVAGYSNNGTDDDFAIVRYNSDGSLDTTFNTTGIVTTDFNGNDEAGNSITVQSDGKILVAGYSNNGTNNDFAIARYNSDGSLDTTFNSTGKVTTDFNSSDEGGYSITVQDDGKILVVGTSNNGSNNDFAIARYNSDGSLDTTFNTTGKVTTDFNGNDEAGNSITVQDDGKVLVAGYSNNGSNDDFAIARYNSDGTLDTTFNTTGKFTSDFNGNDEGGNSIIVQDDDKILVAGVSNNGTDYDFAIARYSVNQSPEVANEIQDVEATQDSVFNFTIPDDAFSDADAEDILTYTATLENDELLPTWLNFNPDTLTFTGTPTNKDVGSLNIKVIATDIAGDEASDVFKLAVEQKADLTILPITLLTIIKGDVFNVKTKLNIKGDKGKLSIKIKTKSSNKVEELCVFNVDDDEGKIDGKAPGTEGYTQAALLRSKVIFCSLGNLPNGFSTADLATILQFDSDTKLRFYMVSNSTTQDVLSGKASFSSVIFSSSTSSNSESSENGGFSLNFESLVVTVEATNQQVTLGTGLQGKKEGELIDLREIKQSVKADFKVHREATLNNCVGFYQIADESGGIDTNNDGVADILVGQAGYAEAAVRQRITGIDLTVTNQGTASHGGTFAAGSLFAPFIIINGKPDAFVDKNSKKNPTVYFAFLGANTDKTDHIRLLGNNTFGFEDLAKGGDKDYNDIIVKIDLTVNAV
ncbi:FG-GAP repeat-containing protein [Nostoc linckia NIES-25]|nr:FG-GAP repeat-containing protein [Nostoc linckia NIES-25]